MKNRLVLYHTNTGNSQFLAEKIAGALQAEVRPLQPRTSSVGWLFVLSLLKWRSGINLNKEDLAHYEEVVVIGPVWGGLLLAPLRDAIRTCRRADKPIHVAVCCGTSDDDKDKRWGYAQVLASAKKMGGDHVYSTEAFPVALVLTPEEYANPEAAQGTRLSDANYAGAMEERVTRFLKKIDPTFARETA